MDTTSACVVNINEARRAPACQDRTGHTVAASDVRVDGWLVQPSLNALTRNEVTVRLRPQLMDLLVCLASRPGKVLLKDELLGEVWDGRWIGQSAISRCIAELRSAMGDDARQPRIIETITKRGYRLIAPVEPVIAVDAVLSPALPPARPETGVPANQRESAVAPRSLRQRVQGSARVFAVRLRSYFLVARFRS
jgi:DNA-binding winged helix-turn-helix (wHTH) protein